MPATDKRDELVFVERSELSYPRGISDLHSLWLSYIVFDVRLIRLFVLRVQNIDSIVRWADRELPVVNTRGDVLFNSWAELFDGAGGIFAQPPRLYSFSGKNILTDISW